MNSWIVDESKWLIINLVGLIQYFDADFPFIAVPIERGFPDVIGFALGLSCGTTAVCAHRTLVTKVDFFFCVPKQQSYFFRFFKIWGFLFNVCFVNWQNYTYMQKRFSGVAPSCFFVDDGVGRVGVRWKWHVAKLHFAWKNGCFATIWLFWPWFLCEFEFGKWRCRQLSAFFKMLWINMQLLFTGMIYCCRQNDSFSFIQIPVFWYG